MNITLAVINYDIFIIMKHLPLRVMHRISTNWLTQRIPLVTASVHFNAKSIVMWRFCDISLLQEFLHTKYLLFSLKNCNIYPSLGHFCRINFPDKKDRLRRFEKEKNVFKKVSVNPLEGYRLSIDLVTNKADEFIRIWIGLKVKT